MTSHTFLPLLLASLTLSLFGCASVPPEQRVESDPWEPMNRPVHAVNQGLDNVLTGPLARGYQKVVPGPVRKGISNFYRNLRSPASIINNALQGKPRRALSETGRFLLNSTAGIGGLFDVATAGGIEEYPEDFGQTAAVWGVPNGPFVMVPLIGPQTLRDAIMLPLDIFSGPLYHYNNASVRDPLYVLGAIDLRYRLLGADQLLKDSKDKYITLRESYLQNREYEVFDGNPPTDDEFFDEFFDEE